jgi:UDP-N-acetylglucosamine 2-epimerase (non-hydrolysing)
LFITGNTIADIVIKAGNKLIEPPLWKELNLSSKKYVLLILDDNPLNTAIYIKIMLAYVQKTYGEIPVIAIGGPEIDKTIAEQNIQAQNLYLIIRLGFLQLGFLLFNSQLVISDSTTVIEQCVMYKNIDILDLSGQTDWLEKSYNDDTTALFSTIRKNTVRTSTIPYMWDGKSAERIIAVLKRLSMSFSDT